MTWTNPVTQTRVDLGQIVASALSMAEEYKTEAEAQHEKVKADPLYDEADRHASLSEVLLSHRALALLRPLSELVSAGDPDAPPIVPTAHRFVHQPAPGWSRAPAEVMGGTVGGLARALYTMGKCTHFDIHVRDDGAKWRVWVDPDAKIVGSSRAIAAAFGEGVVPHKFALLSL